MEHKIGLSTPPSFAFCFAEASERFRQIKSQQQVGAGGAWPHLQLAVPCAAAPRARGLEVNSKGKGLDNPGCGVWKGLDLIPSSCRGEVLPLTMGISLKASAGAPGTGSLHGQSPLPAGTAWWWQECLWHSSPAQNCSCRHSEECRRAQGPCASFGARSSLTAGKSAFGEEGTQSLDVRHSWEGLGAVLGCVRARGPCSAPLCTPHSIPGRAVPGMSQPCQLGAASSLNAS